MVSDAVIGHPVVWLPKGPRGLGEGTVLCSEFPTGDSGMVLYSLFLIFLSTHTKIGFGTKYRSVRSAYISLSFSEVENDPFRIDFPLSYQSGLVPLVCLSFVLLAARVVWRAEGLGLLGVL